jgi:hypothetical protein
MADLEHEFGVSRSKSVSLLVNIQKTKYSHHRSTVRFQDHRVQNGQEAEKGAHTAGVPQTLPAEALQQTNFGEGACCNILPSQ